MFEFPCILLLFLGISSVVSQSEPGGEIESEDTYPKDKTALLNIKAALQESLVGNRSILENWLEETDPCRDNWSLVFCDCPTARPVLPATNNSDSIFCTNHTEPTGERRVVVLNFRGGTVPEEKYSGNLASDIGDLDRLSFLDLRQNAFEGGIPDSFSNLIHLKFLSVAENQLTGEIPDYFKSFSQLVRLELNDNDFSGPLPQMACGRRHRRNEDLQLSRVVVSGNAGLCGNVPRCMRRKVDNVNGTALIHPRYDFNQEIRGVCDLTPPVCEENRGCQVSLPEYWTNPNNISFNFTSFEDPESGIEGYDFRLTEVANLKPEDFNTSTAFLINISRSQVDITNVTEKREVGGETMELVVYVVSIDQANVTGSLEDGSEYSVTVIATNGAGPPLQYDITKERVKYDHSQPEKTDFFNTLPGLSFLDR